jgi:TRAP transporter 4TM/12TM fusion protein
MKTALDVDSCRKKIVILIGCIGTLFHIYNLGFSLMNVWAYRLMHVTFAMMIIFLDKPLLRGKKYKNLDFIINIILVGVLFLTDIYIFSNIKRMEMFMQFSPTTMDVIVCSIGVLLILEMTRRINGWAMPILGGIFILYALFGNYLTGLVSHSGYGIKRLAGFLYSYDAIFGTSIGVSATFVILFIIFGSVMEMTGGGKLFIDSAIFGLGKYRGGPAKAAVVASALMGTISGSSAANVVTTGSFTIPLMKKVGYNNEFAGAVEAAASTGGQIMPPIMGAGAFLMAEALGVPYIEVAKAAIIPALIYFGSIFVMVDLEAIKANLTGIDKSDLPNIRKTFKDYGLLVIPLIVLLYFLIIERTSPIKAGLWSIYSSLIIALLRKTTRYSFKEFNNMMASGMKSALSVIAACACAGVIVGVLTLTGLGAKLVILLVTLSRGNVLIALMLVMIVTIFLGMGLPTTAAYIICSSVVVPALVKMGLEPFPAHFFVFYFACLSAVTPPVAIASYAAAGVSGGDMNKTGWTAFKLALAAFIVPYVFVFNKSLFLMGSTSLIIRSTITSIIGTVVFAHAVSGWFINKANIFVRAALFAASLLLIVETLSTDAIGLALVVICFILQKFVLKKGKPDIPTEGNSSSV